MFNYVCINKGMFLYDFCFYVFKNLKEFCFFINEFGIINICVYKNKKSLICW